jgi:hypothetical protein
MHEEQHLNFDTWNGLPAQTHVTQRNCLALVGLSLITGFEVPKMNDQSIDDRGNSVAILLEI